MKVDDVVLTILGGCRTQDNMLFLPPVQLSRALYVMVNKALECAGGKWNRSKKAHLFDGPAEDALEAILLTGEVTDAKREFGEFFTPPELARKLVDMAYFGDGEEFLEPSCGDGAIALAALEKAPIGMTCVDVQAKNIRALERRLRERHDLPRAGYAGRHVCADFLSLRPIDFDIGHDDGFTKIVMNPPFAKKQDIAHVMHAADFLAPGGRLVAVMGAGVTFRRDGRTGAFHEFLGHMDDVDIEGLPDGSFKDAGTNVNACVVSFVKPAVRP